MSAKFAAPSAAMALAVLVPFMCWLIRKRYAFEKVRREQELEREKNILEVIKSNTKVMTELGATLKAQQERAYSSLARLESKIEKVLLQVARN